MNHRILKYELPVQDEVIVLGLPEHFQMCDIQSKDDKIFLWAVVEDKEEQPIKYRTFKIYGTGHVIKGLQDLYFLKTVVMQSGLVWHVFEVTI